MKASLSLNCRSVCREYAVIIKSLAAASHVLLIPKQTQSCFPTLAITEVFCFLLLNGLTVLLHSSTSNRIIHIYHVWAFHSVIEVILFSYGIKYTKLHSHLSCRHYNLSLCSSSVEGQTSSSEFLYHIQKAKTKHQSLQSSLELLPHRAYSCLSSDFVLNELSCVLFRPLLIAVILACRISISFSLCNY